MSNKEFNRALRLCNMSLFLSGIDVSMQKHKYYTKYLNISNLFYFNIVWLLADVLGEIYWLIDGILTNKSIADLSLVAPCTLMCVMTTVKASYLFYRRYIIFKIITKLKEIRPNGNYNIRKQIYKKQRTIIDYTSKFSKFVTLLLLSICVVVLLAFSSLPLLVMYLEYNSMGNLSLKLPFFVKYFFDPLIFPVWPFVYIHQVYSTCVVLCHLFGSETLFYIFCISLEMHFRLLSVNICYLTRSQYNSHHLDREIKKIIERHKCLIEITSDIQYLYGDSNLFNILISSILICLSGFNLTFSKDIQTIFPYLAFLILSLCQIFMLCYFGDNLMHSSLKVSASICKSIWYKTNCKFQKKLHIVLIRSQKPCVLTAANFANINLAAFTTILSRSWSYFALLKTMYK